MRVSTEMIPAEIAAECAEIGKTWAAHEFDVAADESRKRHNWGRGDYCGNYPEVPGFPEDEQPHYELDQMIDDAAIPVWEALWDAKEATR
jgi:hypothetical protein